MPFVKSTNVNTTTDFEKKLKCFQVKGEFKSFGFEPKLLNVALKLLHVGEKFYPPVKQIQVYQ